MRGRRIDPKAVDLVGLRRRRKADCDFILLLGCASDRGGYPCTVWPINVGPYRAEG